MKGVLDMKKNISLLLVVVLMIGLISCKQNPQKTDSQASPTVSIATESKEQPKASSQSIASDVSSKQQSSETSSESTASEIVSQPQEINPMSQSKVTTPSSKPQTSVQTQTSKPTSSQTTSTVEKVYESTIETPENVYFYKDGKYGATNNEKRKVDVAKCVESWYKDYENDTLPAVKTAVTEEMIANIKLNETVVEICFDYDQKIEFLGKIKLEKTRRLLIPLTGNYAYFVFLGNSAYQYKSGPHRVNGSGLEKYFEGVKLDKDVKNWQSTVIAPIKVTFYKDGMQAESIDKELNHKIARHIEEWYKYEEYTQSCLCYAYDYDVAKIKYEEMAIELQFDDDVRLYGGFIPAATRTIFIPLTGEDDYVIFAKSNDSHTWSHYYVYAKGLEQFFDDIEFTPLTEEEKRWRTTIGAAYSVELYENGKLLGDIDRYNKYELNQKIAEKIESWFYQKEEIPTVTVANTPLDTVWKNETYVKMHFGGNITFYGEQIVSKKSSYLIIPLTGEYAYHIFEGTYDEMSNVAIDIGGSGLEQFFEEFKANNN